jgi:hypothetical protein
MIVTLQRVSIAVTVKKEKLVGNYHPVEIALTSWRVPFKLCKLFLLEHHFVINEHDFFNLVKDQNIQRKKCDDAFRQWIFLTHGRWGVSCMWKYSFDYNLRILSNYFYPFKVDCVFQTHLFKNQTNVIKIRIFTPNSIYY